VQRRHALQGRGKGDPRDLSRAIAADPDGVLRQSIWLVHTDNQPYALVARKPAHVSRYTCGAGHAGCAAGSTNAFPNRGSRKITASDLRATSSCSSVRSYRAQGHKAHVIAANVATRTYSRCGLSQPLHLTKTSNGRTTLPAVRSLTVASARIVPWRQLAIGNQ
jgi:hypothetical protein